MRANDVTDTLELALPASGRDRARVAYKPRLLSDNGSSYISIDLAEWLKDRGMVHVRGAPDPERWHKTLNELDFQDANVARSKYAVKDVRLRDVPWSRFEFVTPPKGKTFSNRNLSVIHNRNRQKRHLLRRDGDPLLLNVA
jgi:hypothetical protein